MKVTSSWIFWKMFCFSSKRLLHFARSPSYLTYVGSLLRWWISLGSLVLQAVVTTVVMVVKSHLRPSLNGRIWNCYMRPSVSVCSVSLERMKGLHCKCEISGVIHLLPCWEMVSLLCNGFLLFSNHLPFLHRQYFAFRECSLCVQQQIWDKVTKLHTWITTSHT